MIDVIRVELPTGIKRFKMFTVSEQLRFLLTSSDMEKKTEQEQQTILDEVLDILYPGYSRTEQEYIFVKVYIASFGKDVIRIKVKSKSKEQETFMIITNFILRNEYKIDDDLTLGFTFPKTRETNDDMFIECISYIKFKDKKYPWNELSEETKNRVVDSVDFTALKEIYTMLRKSCSVEIKKNEFADTLLPLFRILFSKTEIEDFFRTNFYLNKNGLNIDTMMNISPMERTVYVALLADDLKRENNA